MKRKGDERDSKPPTKQTSSAQRNTGICAHSLHCCPSEAHPEAADDLPVAAAANSASGDAEQNSEANKETYFGNAILDLADKPRSITSKTGT